MTREAFSAIYAQGKQAALEHVDAGTIADAVNPYPPRSMEWDKWEDGFLAGTLNRITEKLDEG